jgi:hypothetical protein
MNELEGLAGVSASMPVRGILLVNWYAINPQDTVSIGC